MKNNSKISMIQEIMKEFAGLTGLSPEHEHPRRYLWTDAFAVCNFLELYRHTTDDEYKRLALMLVDQVHNILCRHREDDSRSGWISCLDEKEGKMHPTRGGVRIGKNLTERSPSDPFDESLEWDRDGQYYHYLTKWMHALNRVGQIKEDKTFHLWAVELAKAAHAGFTYTPPSGGQKCMYWKMSIDLSRPLVQSMGQHDPLDGFITYNQLQMSVPDGLDKTEHLELSEEITNMARIMIGKSWVTDDPLGIGGLLSDAYRLTQMIEKGFIKENDLLETILDSSLLGLESMVGMNHLHLPVEYRLAFRELGLSIGLHAVKRLCEVVKEKPKLFKERSRLREYMDILLLYTGLIEEIEGFWLEPVNRKGENWEDHRDINMVMLATSLAPDGFLTI